MAKIKSVTGGFRSVVPIPGQYASIGFEAAFEATLAAGDDPDQVIAELQARAKVLVAEALRQARRGRAAEAGVVRDAPFEE